MLTSLHLFTCKVDTFNVCTCFDWHVCLISVSDLSLQYNDCVNPYVTGSRSPDIGKCIFGLGEQPWNNSSMLAAYYCASHLHLLTYMFTFCGWDWLIYRDDTCGLSGDETCAVNWSYKFIIQSLIFHHLVWTFEKSITSGVFLIGICFRSTITSLLLSVWLPEFWFFSNRIFFWQVKVFQQYYK